MQYKNEGISWPFRISMPELIVNSETIDGGCVKWKIHFSKNGIFLP